MKILVPVDGSEHSARVIDYVIALANRSKQTDLHLLTVREAMDSPQIQRFWSPEQIRSFEQEAGKSRLQSACQRLDAAKVAYTSSVEIGDTAQSIVNRAEALGCDMIVMGMRGAGGLQGLLVGSVATKVVHLASIPVTLIK